ncbi:MAG: hypothetical protein WD069_13335 [Planctomycetales bacterium]
MNRFRFAFALGCLLFSASPAFAAKEAIDAIPADAALVVRLKSPKTTLANVIRTVATFDPQLAAAIQQGQARIGGWVANPTLAGIDDGRDWWMAAFLREGAEPALAFAIPAKDPATMRLAVGAGFHFVTDGDLVFYTRDAEVAAAIEALVRGGEGSISATMSESSRAAFDAGDFSAYLHLARVRELFRDDLDLICDELDATLRLLEEHSASPPGVDLPSVIAAYRTLAHAALQSIEDAEGLAVGARLDAKGLDLEQYFAVTPGSPTARALAAHSVSPLKLLEQLPPDSLAYVGIHGDAAGTLRRLAAWRSAFAGANDAARSADASLLEELAALDVGDLWWSFKLGQLADGALEGAAIVAARPPEQARELARKLAASFPSHEAGGLRPAIALRPDAEQNDDGTAADVLALRLVGNPAAPSLGAAGRIADVLIGPGEKTGRLAPLPDGLVATVGMTREKSAQLVQGVRDAQAGHPQANAVFAATRSRLPEQANLIVIADVAGIAHEALRLAIDTGKYPLPVNHELLKRLDLRRTYLGIGVAADSAGVRVVAHVPAKQLEGLQKMSFLLRASGVPGFAPAADSPQPARRY